MADLKGWRHIRAERDSGRTTTWYRRHNALTIPEYSLNLGISRGFFWLTLAWGKHRIVIDRYKTDKRGTG